MGASYIVKMSFDILLAVLAWIIAQLQTLDSSKYNKAIVALIIVTLVIQASKTIVFNVVKKTNKAEFSTRDKWNLYNDIIATIITMLMSIIKVAEDNDIGTKVLSNMLGAIKSFQLIMDNRLKKYIEEEDDETKVDADLKKEEDPEDPPDVEHRDDSLVLKS